MNHTLNRRVRGRSGVSDTQSLNALRKESSAACRRAEEANDRISLGAGAFNSCLIDKVGPSRCAERGLGRGIRTLDSGVSRVVARNIKLSASAVRDGSRADTILEITIQSVLTVGACAHVALENQGYGLAAVGA